MRFRVGSVGVECPRGCAAGPVRDYHRQWATDSYRWRSQRFCAAGVYGRAGVEQSARHPLWQRHRVSPNGGLLVGNGYSYTAPYRVTARLARVTAGTAASSAMAEPASVAETAAAQAGSATAARRRGACPGQNGGSGGQGGLFVGNGGTGGIGGAAVSASGAAGAGGDGGDVGLYPCSERVAAGVPAVPAAPGPRRVPSAVVAARRQRGTGQPGAGPRRPAAPAAWAVSAGQVRRARCVAYPEPQAARAVTAAQRDRSAGGNAGSRLLLLFARTGDAGDGGTGGATGPGGDGGARVPR